MNRCLRFAFLTLMTSVSLTAQVPEGWAVASAWRQFNYTTGGGGLLVFHPDRAEPAWEVTGLPADLTGIGVATPNNLHGANSVLIRPSDGRLLVGERSGLATDTLEIHEITLSGQAATQMVRHAIGTRDPAANGMNVHEMAWLPDGRVLFAHQGVVSPMLGTSGLAILDLATSAVTEVAVTGVSPAGVCQAVAVDDAGTTAFFSIWSSGDLYIYSVPVPSGGPATLVGSLPGARATELNVDGDALVMIVVSGGSFGLYQLTSGQWTNLAPSITNMKGGLTIDRVTGNFVARVDGPQRLERIERNGTRTTVHTLPQNSLVISGIDIMPSMATYGTEMPDAYRWSIADNPGGAPLVGNANFSVTAVATTAPLPGVMFLGLQEANQQVLGFQLLVDPLLFVDFLNPSATNTSNVPIPNSPGLVGARFFAQTVHVSATFVSSKGLRFTIY